MRLVDRAEWGAVAPRSVSRMTRPATGVWLHHSVTADQGAQSVRSVQNVHMGAPRGYADIGYSWLYSPSRREFYVGRGRNVVGAHTFGHNGYSEGLCVLGNYAVNSLPEHAVSDVAGFLRWRGLPLLGGHRDASGAATACPGRHLYSKIDDICAAVAGGTDVEDVMAGLTPEAQAFYQKQYELLVEQDARPSSLPTVLAHYRYLRDWFRK